MKTISGLTPVQIDRLGFKALCDALGTGGALRFLQQAGGGRGDYTKERDAILRGSSLAELAADARNVEKEWKKSRKRPGKKKSRKPRDARSR